MAKGSHASGDAGDGRENDGLPDFAAPRPGTAADGLPDLTTQRRAVTLGAPTERARNRSRALIITVLAGAVVIIGVVALVLSQTLFRSALDPGPTAYPTGPRGSGHSEYVPDPNDPNIAPPPPLFTQAPTSDCTIPEHKPVPEAGPGKLRGGGLEYTTPKTWDHPWGYDALPYLNEVNGQGRNVEGSWYSVVNLGRVAFPKSEGGYPGAEQAAVTIFQCYATTAGVLSYFGDKPKVTDYRTESTTVDGTPAWIVQATYHFENPNQLATTNASIVTSIVVETPGGPSALISDVAADHPDHVKELDEIIASLKVVS